MPSPRPKPTHLKVVSGNPGKRKLNKTEPQPRREIPSCPPHLSDVGKVAWGRMGVMLDRIGVLTEADGLALERLCDCYAEILECRDLIIRDGRTYKSIKLLGGSEEDGIEQVLMKANPAVAMLADADRRFKGYLIEFGMTPSARSKVHVIEDDNKKGAPLAEFFG